eukprot:685730-Hanusia_phi.AAC.2
MGWRGGPRAVCSMQWRKAAVAGACWAMATRGGEACTDMRVAYGSVDIRPSTCSYWSYAGSVESSVGGVAVKLASWRRDCNIPGDYAKTRMTEEGGNGAMSFSDGVVLAESAQNVGRIRTRVRTYACNGDESVITETVSGSEGSASTTGLLTAPVVSYQIESSTSNDNWVITTPNVPLTSYQLDFSLKSDKSPSEEKVAKAQITDYSNRENYSANLCVRGSDGSYMPKWSIEFFTDDAAVRRSILACVLFKAMRDDRR